MTRAFQIHAGDNVAVLIDDATAGPVRVLGPGDARELLANENIRLGHKIALAAIGTGQAIVKYGVRIGHATAPIPAGAWVHLHNAASDYDERSNTLDAQTGAPSDISYT